MGKERRNVLIVFSVLGRFIGVWSSMIGLLDGATDRKRYLGIQYMVFWLASACLLPV